MITRIGLAACVGGLLLAASGSASAQNSGLVRGRLFFFQAQGNFCNATAGFDCTGANYTNAQFNTHQPAKEVKLRVKNSSGGTIGTGSTDDAGNFFVQWSTSGSFLNARVEWETAHSSGRFKVMDLNGNTSKAHTNPFNLIAAGTVVDIGDRFWDSAAAPGTWRNAYDGAWMMWRNSLSQSDKMVSRFTNVDIRGFTNSGGTDCPTSCTNGLAKTVRLDDTAPFRPDPRVMHELGHVASRQSDGSRSGAGQPGYFNYPSVTGTGSWNLNSTEWRAAQFEEAFATFLGNIALWHWSSNMPHTCFPATPGGSCALGDNFNSANFNIEASAGFGAGGSPTGCFTDPDHVVINVLRYLWDVYDGPANGEDTVVVCGCGNISGCQFVTDSDGQDQHEFLNVLDNAVKGINFNQNDEIWANTSFTALDERDGRAYRNFRNNWRDRGPASRDTTNSLCINCLWGFLPQ